MPSHASTAAKVETPVRYERDLLPCPFCGQGPRAATAQEGWRVECSPGCGASGPAEFTRVEAAEGWNRRAVLDYAGKAAEIASRTAIGFNMVVGAIRTLIRDEQDQAARIAACAALDRARGEGTSNV